MNKYLKKIEPQCYHIWRKQGAWHGIELQTNIGAGGPMAECIICGKQKAFTHSDWEELNENSKFNQDCQSCGRWMEYENLGTNTDSSKNTMYCFDCYRGGKFTEPNLTLQQMVEKVAETKSLRLNLPKKEIARAEAEFISKIKRWQK